MVNVFIERKIPLNNVFNDLRPIFRRLIFQLSNTFNDLRHIYIRNKVAIFNKSKFGAVNVFIDVKIDVNFIFNDLRPIFSRLIFQPVNVFTHLKFEVSFVFNDLRHIYIRNKVAIFNKSKFGAVNYDLL